MDAVAVGQESQGTSEVPIRLELDCAPTIGYASIQNSVPAVRSVRLTNRSDADLSDVELLVRCDPGFAQGAKFRFQKVAPGETRSLGPIDLQPDHTYLANLQEGMSASVSLHLLQGERELARESKASRSTGILTTHTWGAITGCDWSCKSGPERAQRSASQSYPR